MTEADLFDQLDAILEPIGSTPEDGISYSMPPLDVVRYDRRSATIHWLPVIGRGMGVVATIRQPEDLGFESGGYPILVKRAARAAEFRFPPWPRGGPGFTIGLSLLVLSPEPITPDDPDRLRKAIPTERRSRAVTLGLFRLNLEQEAMAFALAPAPEDVFPEPFRLAEGLSEGFRQFVPPVEF